jgi:hypothetical protein
MRRVLVRYKVTADRAAENEAFIREVFRELAKAAPTDVRYTSLKLEDGVSFVHIMEAEGGGGSLTELPAFKAFTAKIRDRCEEPPAATEFSPVGAYRVFAV